MDRYKLHDSCRISTQDQYIFLHDAILESVTCGDTQITSGNLRRTINTLGDKGFSHQFTVSVNMP